LFELKGILLMEFAMTGYRSRPDIIVNSITSAEEPVDGDMEAAVRKSTKRRCHIIDRSKFFPKGGLLHVSEEKRNTAERKGRA
jgi:hypothetical protein